MPFSEPLLSLSDIRDAISAIEEFTNGMDLNAFRNDLKTTAVVERKRQVISEAAVRLGDQAESRCPGLPWHTALVHQPSGLRPPASIMSTYSFSLMPVICDAMN